MVVVTRARALLRLFEAYVPHWAEVFSTYRRLPIHRRQPYLNEQYAALPTADFSRDVLAQAQGLAVYSWGQAMGWSDLGTPDRLYQWLNEVPA